MIVRIASVFAFILVCTAQAASAQDPQQAAWPFAEPSKPCVATFSGGSGASLFRFCVTAAGNVLRTESPSAQEHIAVGVPVEGYVVCTADDWNPRWDVGSRDHGWEPPVVSQPNGPNTLPLAITRDTEFGNLRLTQFFARDSARREITITMRVTNRGAATAPGVRLQRFFDGDLSGDSHDDLYGATAHAVFGADPQTGNGLMLSATTLTRSHSTVIEHFSSFAASSHGECRNGTSTARAESTPADSIGRVGYVLGDIAPGSSKTVEFRYRMF
jgi:hypothetical protein